MLCIICGGTGGARLARGISQICDPTAVTYICNVGDNIRLFGLTICPDIDAVIYALAGIADSARGWGVCEETFATRDQLRRFYGDVWFNIGDKDMATHVWRTDLLRAGHCLSAVSEQEALLLGVRSRVLPATDAWVETHIALADPPGPSDLHYEDFFVRLRCEPPVRHVRYEGIKTAEPAPGVLAAIDAAEAILIAPSNPLASVLPVVSVPGIREALTRKRTQVWAVSPIIAGLPLVAGEERRARSRRHLLASVGLPDSPAAIGSLYHEFCSNIVLDKRDETYADELSAMGCAVHLLATDALTDARQVALAQELAQLIPGIDPCLAPHA